MPYTGYYINLSNCSDRKEELESHLVQVSLGGRYVRHSAADGQVLSKCKSPLSSGEIACFTSHYQVLNKATTLDNHLHIIEDDVVFSRHAPAILTSFTESDVLDNWDIIFTDVFVPLDLAYIREYKTLFESSVERGPFGQVKAIRNLHLLDLHDRIFAATASYLVGRNSIAKVASMLGEGLLDGPTLPVDLFIRKKVSEGHLRAACVFPFITSVNLNHSINSSIEVRQQALRSVIACNLLRYSFFTDCAWLKCQELLTKHFPPPQSNSPQDDLLIALTRFATSPDHKVF